MPPPETLTLDKTFTQSDFDLFASLSGDDNPIHVDPGFSAKTRFGRTVSHGMLLSTVFRGLLERLLPGSRQLSQRLTFPSPTFAGERMRFSVQVQSGDGETVVVSIRCERVADDVVTCIGDATMRRGTLVS